MPEERRAIHAYLTLASHSRWHAAAEENGVSLSGLLEVMAEDMDDNPIEEQLIVRARKIDALRRRRG